MCFFLSCTPEILIEALLKIRSFLLVMPSPTTVTGAAKSYSVLVFIRNVGLFDPEDEDSRVLRKVSN
jgi:hypothetical protein